MISNNIKENNKAISVKQEKTNKIKNHKSIGIKTKTLIELIEIIEQIKKQQNSSTIKTVNKKESLKKDLEEVSEVNNKKTFRRWEKDYISLIQNIVYKQLFYDSSFRFNYNNYIVNHENKTFSQMSAEFNTSLKEAKYYDSPILDNNKIDDIMQKIKFGEMSGHVNGDYFIPENIAPDDFERFYYFKKLNPTLIMLKYELKSK